MKIIKNFRIWFYYLKRDFFRSRLLKKISKFALTEKGYNISNEADFLIKNGITVFPYPFINNYSKSSIELSKVDGYPVVNYKEKNLYFPNSYSDEKVINYAHNLFIEQDENSPHSYKSPIFNIDCNDILIDIGCAEANYSLEVVHLVKEVYLFEADRKWIDPLTRTFAPWKDKVKIYNKKFGNEEGWIYEGFQNRDLLIKIDVDGNEREVLKSLDYLLKVAKSIKVAICTYHKNLDAIEFNDFFISRGFRTQFGKGFMLFYYDKKIKKPYLRPGILFAHKVND